MRVILLVVWCLAIVVAGTSISEAAILSGKATDPSGSPLEGAFVGAYLVNAVEAYETHTAMDGTYSLDLPAGTYYISAAHDGYPGLHEVNGFSMGSADATLDWKF